MFSFDESLNDMTQSCEMDPLLRYFDEIDCQVKVKVSVLWYIERYPKAIQ